MKLAVIGGGGVRSMFLAKSIAQRAVSLHITELVFMDNDEKKLRIYGSMAAHVSALICPALVFRLTTDPEEALRDADYVITTIRVGGDHMRVREERIALAAGVIGQETTGAAGLSFAMRSVPALAKICDLVRKVSKPSVKVFNFTNPAGVVSQTLRDMGYDFTYGICDAPSGMLHQFADLYGVPAHRMTGECYGLNHLSFFRQILLDGRDILPELIKRRDAYTETDLRFFEPELLSHMGMVLNEYLYYFYYREKALENILHAPQTRGEVIEEINREMTAELEKMDLEHDFDGCLAVFEKWYGRREDAYMANETGIRRNKPWKFDVFSEDDGGYAGVALRFIDIAESGEKGSMILCAPNRGAIPTLLDDDIVEITCDITRDECIPHIVPDPDERALELIRRVKSYERLASRAIRERNRAAAVDCLALHPLVNSYSLAVKLVDQFITLNGGYINGWK